VLEWQGFLHLSVSFSKRLPISMSTSKKELFHSLFAQGQLGESGKNTQKHRPECLSGIITG
jgi:hypothetical protein